MDGLNETQSQTLKQKGETAYEKKNHSGIALCGKTGGRFETTEKERFLTT